MKDKEEDYITDKLLINLGFKRERFYCKHFEAFRLKYIIEGYDDDIILKSYTSISGYKTPEQQVEEYSSIDDLIHCSQPPYQVYSGDSHITTISNMHQLIELSRVLDIEVNA
jgi:hypothetical protein